MNIRSYCLGAAALAGFVLAPTGASAQIVNPCGLATYSFSLGLGGSLAGCFTGVLTQLGEDAGFVSQQYYWAGNFGTHSGPTNAPSVAGTFMYSDDCGSAGNGTFAFCTGSFVKPPAVIANASGEMVLGLLVPDNTYGTGSNWVYSGARTRNDTPLPAGFQSVLLQLTLNGVDDPGHFLFGWEDLNTGCTNRVSQFNNRYREEDLGNATILDSRLDDCTVELPGGNSDSDFNDSYMQFVISGTGVPTDIGVVPEPVTMSLLAMGLVGMGGASLTKRRKK
jgi:hypothetical protein